MTECERQATLLVADDEPEIVEMLQEYFVGRGFRVLTAGSGQEALEQAAHGPDLVLLDVGMPRLDGFEVCRRLREHLTCPILFLTAKTQLGDKASAYASGGDDFLPKPFSQSELLMKVDSLLRRYRVYKGKREEVLDASLHLDEDRRCAVKNGRVVELTSKEYDILQYFFLHRGKVLDVRSVYEGAWGEKYMPTSTNTVMVHILNLRKKLEEDPTNPKLIRTIWGKGYQFG